MIRVVSWCIPHMNLLVYLLVSLAGVQSQCETPSNSSNTTGILPAGSYQQSCFNCTMEKRTLQCRCLRAGDIRNVSQDSHSLHPDIGMQYPNITGAWTVTSSAEGLTGGVLIISADPTNINSTYNITCTDPGNVLNGRLCDAFRQHPPVYPGQRQPWHNGSGTYNTISGRSVLALSNNTYWMGNFSFNGSVAQWVMTNATNSTNLPNSTILPSGMVWKRLLLSETGYSGSIPLSSCKKVKYPNHDFKFNISNENGFLTCDWTDKPPPRVGEYTFKISTHTDESTNCRTIPATTFMAPQMSLRENLLAKTQLQSGLKPYQQTQRCCTLCRTQIQSGSIPCKAWTITGFGMDGAVCHLFASGANNYPAQDESIVSGYPLHTDPASLCMAKFESNNGFWGDKKMADGIDCLAVPSINGSFPQWWWDGKHNRGQSWMFFPTRNLSAPSPCRCVVTAPQVTICEAPNLTASNISELITGKPWIVFVHGGAFQFYDGITANYAETNSFVSKAAGMGVLAIDYQSLARVPNPAQYPEPVEDVIEALLWLQKLGASSLYLYGDSSGGTQVVETLLYLAATRLRLQRGQDFPDFFSKRKNGRLLFSKKKEAADLINNLTIQAAATFSSWLDFSSSLPQYDTRRSCGGSCTDIGNPVFAQDPGPSRLGGMCQSQLYTNKARISLLDGASPIDATPDLLAQLPPLMLIVGGQEVLLGENIFFAQKAQQAGAAVVTEVFTDMWHDFMQESQGCGSGKKLMEGITAIQRLGDFLKTNRSCKVTCSDGTCQGYSPVKWHFNYHELPPPSPRDC
eukprot:m.3565 g.3565  ORF g.3565 m.3565 type:complete len:799 (-) comp2788_c0_seq1:42-2438(-)